MLDYLSEVNMPEAVSVSAAKKLLQGSRIKRVHGVCYRVLMSRLNELQQFKMSSRPLSFPSLCDFHFRRVIFKNTLRRENTDSLDSRWRFIRKLSWFAFSCRWFSMTRGKIYLGVINTGMNKGNLMVIMNSGKWLWTDCSGRKTVVNMLFASL